MNTHGSLVKLNCSFRCVYSSKSFKFVVRIIFSSELQAILYFLNGMPCVGRAIWRWIFSWYLHLAALLFLSHNKKKKIIRKWHLKVFLLSHCRTTAMIATGNQSIFSKNTKQKDQIQNLTTFLQVLIRVQKVQFINCWLPPQSVISVFISVSRVSRLVTPSGSSVPSLQTQITSCQHCQQQSSSQLVT